MTFQEKAVALVKEIAAIPMCEDERDKCSSESGPYCGNHGLGDDERLIRKARELIREEDEMQMSPKNKWLIADR